MSKLLSICIPTYNRATFLKEALASVVDQVTPRNIAQVEIVISDNASEDETEEIVRQIQYSKAVTLTYHKNAQNIGFDRNILQVVKLAQGQYCWLLGDDDRLVAGAIEKIVEEIGRHPEVSVFMCNRTEYDRGFTQKQAFIPELNVRHSTTFDFARSSIESYLKLVRNLAGLFGFVSTLIFKKADWQQVTDRDQFIGTEYIQVYMIMAMLWGSQKRALRYLVDKLVEERLNNDRFPPCDERLRFEVEYYRLFAGHVLKSNRLVHEIDNIVIKSGGFSWVVNAKLIGGIKFYFEIVPLLFRYYWRNLYFWFKIVPIIILPARVVKLARELYRKRIKPLVIKGIYARH